ncbi:MAG: hypothetical protein HY901_16315 [Deltaproteobacteria bacterium]|nr:hypothetical protein [Deltaproteobacteria bacterium]
MSLVAALRLRLRALLVVESGQAMTETASLYFFILVGVTSGGYVLTRFAPDVVSAVSVYVNSFYLVLGLPIG